MEVDDLFPAAEALQLLRLAEVEGGDIRLTEAGLQFARDDTDDRKKLFARHLITYVPLAAHVRRVLDERSESTRLNSSHLVISYAVFCLKKKKSYIDTHLRRLTSLRHTASSQHTRSPR